MEEITGKCCRDTKNFLKIRNWERTDLHRGRWERSIKEAKILIGGKERIIDRERKERERKRKREMFMVDESKKDVMHEEFCTEALNNASNPITIGISFEAASYTKHCISNTMFNKSINYFV